MAKYCRRSRVSKNRWPSWYRLAVCTALVAACGLTEPTVDSGLAYVTTPDALWVIDTRTHEVASQRPGLFGLPRDVRIAPDNAFLYIADVVRNGVHVLRTEDNSVVSFVRVDEAPAALAITPLGDFIYTVNFRDRTVSVIETGVFRDLRDLFDRRVNDVVNTIPIPAGGIGAAVAPDGSFVYVTNQATNTVSVISPETHSVTMEIDVGESPQQVAISPDGSIAYVPNFSTQDLSVIDTEQHRVIATVPTGVGPVGVAFSPDGSFAYVTHFIGTHLYVLETETHTVVDSLDLGNTSLSIAFMPGAGIAYITSFGGGGQVFVVNTETLRLIRTVQVSQNPWGVVFSRTPGTE